MLVSCLRTVVSQQDRSRARYALLTRLRGLSREIFPNINFLVQEDNSSFQAQAYVRDGQQIVSVFGGLAFHRCVQKDGLLFSILHEIGHHVAPGPRITRTDPRSCDCAADRWVLAEGQHLFSSRGMTLDIRSALSEIELAISDLMPAHDLKSEQWCFDWARRKMALTSIAAPQVVECEFRKFYI
jgi:hypothetical protein